MAKITRAIQKIFGADAAGDEIAQIGSLRAGGIVYTTNLVTMQGLSQYDDGLNGIVHISKFIPALEDINAMYFMLTTQVAYGFQEGIPEYDATTEYHQNSIVKDPGTYDLYYSLQNTNTGNALTEGAWWLPLPMDHADLTNVTANQHHNQSHALSGGDHTGDLVYSQVDAIVDIAGGGSSSLLSRADHKHTDADGSSKIAHANTTGRTANDHHSQAHTLASHSSKDHSELTTVTSDQHHNESHSLASHSSKDHSELTGVGVDDHHNKSHGHTSGDGSGQLDWDTCWSDAVHDHSSDAEGGALDAIYLRSDTSDTMNGTLTLTAIKPSGAEAIKIYTYTHNITAQNAIDNYCEITITSVTHANVRLLQACAHKASDDTVYNWDVVGGGLPLFVRIVTNTTCRVQFGTAYLENDDIMVTIIEAV